MAILITIFCKQTGPQFGPQFIATLFCKTDRSAIWSTIYRRTFLANGAIRNCEIATIMNCNRSKKLLKKAFRNYCGLENRPVQ